MPRPIQRLYSLSDATLKQKCDSVAASMNRDTTEFATRGVTAILIAAFAEMSDDFGNMDSDETWQGNLTDAVQEKDALADALKNKVRPIRNMAEIKYGVKSGKYRSFGFDDMAALSDEKLVRMGRRVHKQATTLQADLATEGLTAAMLTDLLGTIGDFDESIDDKTDVEKTRDIAQQDRVIAGNELYKLLEKYCSIGKAIWQNDPAKYNDYVIYTGGNGEEENPEQPN